MHQIVLTAPGHLTLRHVERPEPRPGQALVRVRRIGICGTDLHAYAGRQPFFTYPRVLGHELAVVVERVEGADGGVQPGDTCAVRPFLNNPGSRASLRGRTNCCEDLAVLGVHVDGGMSEWLAIDARFLHPASGLPLDALALIEPLSIGCHAVSRAAVASDETVLVVGAGPIGLATAQFASLTGATVTILDLVPQRRERAAGLLPRAIVSGEPPARPVDVVFDATGHAGSMMRSFDFVAAGGRLVFVGLTLDPISFSDPDFHRREITLLASRNATARDFERVLAAVQARAVEPLRWITHRVPLVDLPQRFDSLRQAPDLLKAIVEVE
jgi:2-desacetyl-2-hydroxyethyl bacteriochlorophyllide A dehydrogenase